MFFLNFFYNSHFFENYFSFCFRYMAKFKPLWQLNIKRCWMHYQILQICTDKENNGTRIFRLKFVLLKLFYFSLHCFLVKMFLSYRMLQFSNFFVVIFFITIFYFLFLLLDSQSSFFVFPFHVTFIFYFRIFYLKSLPFL